MTAPISPSSPPQLGFPGSLVIVIVAILFIAAIVAFYVMTG